MKKRKLDYIILFVCLLLVCTGCIDNKSQKNQTDSFGVYDIQTQQIMHLGDNRATIEKYIGIASCENSDSTHYSGIISCEYGANSELFAIGDKELTIEYDEENTAVKFIIYPCDEESERRFELTSGVTCFSTVTEFQEAYPQFHEEKIEDSNKYISYIHYISENDKYKVYTKDETLYNSERDNTIKTAIKENEKLKFDVEKLREIESDYKKKWIFVAAEYYDYSDINIIEVGYGWE